MDKYYKVNEKVNGYSIVKIIGEGRYGIAYLGMNNKYQKCVIKQLKNDMLEQTREKLFYEEQILRRLNNPHFPRFISRFKDKYREGYILEYIEGEVLYDLLWRKYQFNRDRIYRVGSQVLDMVAMLHKENIVHRDIRPPNVIIKRNNELALIDFGLARNIDYVKYVKEMDYWYIGDFLLYLYYSTYRRKANTPERPWFEELSLSNYEIRFLKKLLLLEGGFRDMEEVKYEFRKLRYRY
jgi:serine/threonine protein kinase